MPGVVNKTIPNKPPVHFLWRTEQQIPEDVLISIISVYVTLFSKTDFAGGIKLRIMRWKDYPQISQWIFKLI
jgi:hypothetical protein